MQLHSSNRPLTPLFTTIVNNNAASKWIDFPIKYSQLPLDTNLSLSVFVYDFGTKISIGESRLNIFNIDELVDESLNYTVKKGYQKILLTSEVSSADDLDRKIKLYENGDINSLDWLDNLVFRKLEQINRQNSQNSSFINLEFLQFDTPVVFSDVKYSILNIPTFDHDTLIETIFDPDQYRDYNNDDPIEWKFRKLERIHQSSSLDTEIRPTLKIRNRILSILSKQFFEKLSLQERNLIWKFRFYLLNNFINASLQFNNFVINFIKCINWDDEFEITEFLNIINHDENLFIKELQIVDCLELLSDNYHHPIIRKLAIERLKLAKDDDLELYFLQLVQSLKNENDIDEDIEETELIESTNSSEYALIDNDSIPSTKNLKQIKLNSPLLNFLIDRSVNNIRLTIFFYWYLKIECDDEMRRKFETRHEDDEVDDVMILDNHLDNKSSLIKFVKDEKIFHKTLNNFIFRLLNSANGATKLSKLTKQIEFFHKIHNISMSVKLKKDSVLNKIEHLRKLVDEYSKFDPIPLPLDPNIEICGIVVDKCSVFKSSLSPLKITFETVTSQYALMYKIGDDLRQDQFIIQIISLIEKILQNENLDLKLTPYKILPLGEVEGLIEFIPNESLSSILSNYQNSILYFLQTHNPDPNSHLKVSPVLMDNYIRSCAGYCVITYLLGIGDRHLDNLLLTKDGFFFHADFGYILGADPKPFPPLMKLPIQIIEGMGGLDDENYKFFCNYCFITYITLRKNSNLILNLFQLMIDKTIPVLQTTNGDELEKIALILKIKEKFMLELSDEDAIVHFQNLINDSVNAFLPVVIDRLHSFAQYWRS